MDASGSAALDTWSQVAVECLILFLAAGLLELSIKAPSHLLYRLWIP